MPRRSADPHVMPDLAQLISERKHAHGWTFRQLEARSGEAITYQRWQQLATGKRITEFPEPATLQAIADALDVDVTAVVVAAAKTIGLPVRQSVGDFASRLPADVDEMESDMRDALLGVIRVASRRTHETQEPGTQAGGAVVKEPPPISAAEAAQREIDRAWLAQDPVMAAQFANDPATGGRAGSQVTGAVSDRGDTSTDSKQGPKKSPRGA